MGLVHPLDLSDWAKNLTMRIFYRACRNAAWKIGLFKLLTHHYITPHTLIILPTATWQPLLFSIVWNQCGWKSHLHLELYACKVRLRKIQIFLLQKAEKTILKRFFSCFKTILHRNQKGNALECKQATKLDLTVCTLLYLAQKCVQLSQQKKKYVLKKKKVEFWPEMKIWVLRQQLIREMPSWIGHWK